MSAFKIFSIATFLAIFGQIESLNVSVYYEGFGVESKKFITTQLYPVHRYNLDEVILNIALVPFGKTEVKIDDDGKYSFKCPHGDYECYANKVQSCAIYMFPRSKAIKFVNCAMLSDSSNNTLLENCCTTAEVSWATVQTCINNGFADDLLASNGDVTNALEPPLDAVPTIIFEYKFDQALQDSAMTDFLKTACTFYETKPDGCP